MAPSHSAASDDRRLYNCRKSFCDPSQSEPAKQASSPSPACRESVVALDSQIGDASRVRVCLPCSRRLGPRAPQPQRPPPALDALRRPPYSSRERFEPTSNSAQPLRPPREKCPTTHCERK